MYCSSAKRRAAARLWHWHERLGLGVKIAFKLNAFAAHPAASQVLSNLCHTSDCYVTRHVVCESECIVTELAACKGRALITSYTTHTSVK